jgi:hypothetical protein
MSAIKSALFAVTLVAISAAPAHAVLIAMLLPFHKASELVVGIVSRCDKPASYTLLIKNAVNNELLYRTSGRIGANHGVALPYSFGANQTGWFRVGVKWECPELDAAKQRPLVGFTVRDADTKVPRFLGGDELLD